MRLPHPWQAVRWIAAAYTYGGAGLLLVALAAQAIHDGGVYLTASPRHEMDGEALGLMVTYLLAALLTGWSHMEALAEKDADR
jgi:hypothetical protein